MAEAATWQDVENSEQFRALNPEQKEIIRNEFFEKRIKPKVPKDKVDQIRREFDAKTLQKAEEPQVTGEIKPYEPSVWERVGDFFGDVLSTMQFEGSLTTDAATSLLRSKQATPVYDEQGQLLDVRYETDEERKKRIKNTRIIQEKSLGVPEIEPERKVTKIVNGEEVVVTIPRKVPTARLVGEVAAEIIDPIAYLSGLGIAKSTVNTSARLIKLATAGTVYEGTAASLEQMAQQGEITDTQEIVGRAVAGGIAMPAVDTALRSAAKIYKKFGKKKAEKMVDKIQADVDEGMKQGLNPTAAFQRSMQARGVDDQMMTEIVDRAGKKVKIKYRPPDTPEPQDVVQKKVNKFSSAFINAKQATKESASATKEWFDKYVGVMSTRVAKVSPKLAGAQRRFEYNIKTRTHKAQDEFIEFNNAYRKMSKSDKREFKRYMLNGDRGNVEAFLARSGNAELAAGYKKVRPLLDNLYRELEDAGYEVGYVDDYFPRIIRDYKSFLKKLGAKEQDRVQRAIGNAEAEKGAPLTDVEKSTVINQELRRRSGVSTGTSAFKERKVEKVTDQILDEYDDLPEALHTYTNNMIHKLEARKFYGHNLPEGAELPGVNANVRQQLDAMLSREASAGNITWDDKNKLMGLMESRFGPGEVASPRKYQAAKNIFYMATIGNVRSTITQAGDLAISGALHGPVRTARAVTDMVMDAVPQVIGGNKRRIQLRPQDIGIDQITQEFESTIKTSRALNKIFKFSGFRKMDQIGKTSLMNASLRKMQKQSLSDKGIQKIKDKYAPSFSAQEMDQVIADLKNKNITDNVKFMVFSELSDAQPITLSEMPQKYLDHPKGRIAYMLKSFTIKQLDIMRRTAFQEMKKGNVAKGSYNLAKFGMMLTAANMGTDSVKDWMLGRETEIEDKVVSNLYKNFGVSEYVVNKAGTGQASEAFLDVVMPPLSVADAPATDLMNLGKAFYSGDAEDVTFETGRHAPLAGPMSSVLYNYFTEGDWEESK